MKASKKEIEMTNQQFITVLETLKTNLEVPFQEILAHRIESEKRLEAVRSKIVANRNLIVARQIIRSVKMEKAS